MKTLKILFFILILALSQSCTKNDGDIGFLWGMWRVTSIEVNGVEKEGYSGTLYFSFQASVYTQKFVYESSHSSDETYASWKQDGDDLLINFSEDVYAPLPITGMQRGLNLVRIEYSQGDDMTWSYESPEGVKYTYYMKKW